MRSLLVLLLSLPALAADPPKPKAKLPVGKDTTYFTTPLDAEGFVDYEKALNDKLGRGIRPEQNAAVMLMQAIGPKPDAKELPADFYKYLGIKPLPADDEYLIPDDKFFHEERRGDFDAQLALESRLKREPWKAKDHPRFAEWLKANELPLVYALQASQKRASYTPVVHRTKDGKPGMLLGASISPLPQVRQLASLLSTRAMLKLGEGKAADAWADLLALHRIARHAARGGLVTVLVGVACEMIATQSTLAFLEHAKPTADECAGYLADLAQLPPPANLAESVGLFERVMFLDATQHMARDGHARLGEIAAAKLPKELEEAIAARLDWGAVMKHGNAWYDRMAEVHTMPRGEKRAKQFDAIDADLAEQQKRLAEPFDVKKFADEGMHEELIAALSDRVSVVQIGLMALAARKMQDSVDRATQQHRNLRLAIALAAHHADAKAYPEKLADLAPKYLKAVPADLFSGKPLTYERTKEGYRFYSVGVNGKDDGGAGDDLGVTVPRPKK